MNIKKFPGVLGANDRKELKYEIFMRIQSPDNGEMYPCLVREGRVLSLDGSMTDGLSRAARHYGLDGGVEKSTEVID